MQPKSLIREAEPERLLVCLNDYAAPEDLVRKARQLAQSLQADWVALYVETPQHHRLSDRERDPIARALRLAEHRGGQAIVLPGQVIVDELLGFAQAHQVTTIVVGKAARSGWRTLRPALADEVVRRSGKINVLLITGEREASGLAPFLASLRAQPVSAYAFSSLILAAVTVLALLTRTWLDASEISYLYLIAVVLSATSWGLGASIFTSFSSVLLLDLLFYPPYGLLSLDRLRDGLTLTMFLVVSVVISEMAARVRAEVKAVREREQQTAALYALSQGMSRAKQASDVLETATQQIAQLMDAKAMILLPSGDRGLVPYGGAELDSGEQGEATRAFQDERPTGSGISSGGSLDSYWPLRAAKGTLGVLRVRRREGAPALLPHERRLLETIAGQVAISLENARLSEQAEQARLLEVSERFHQALLSSISHDLRTPLASIVGAVTSLMDRTARLDASTRNDMLVLIYEEAGRLSRFVANLLEMTRLEAGALKPRRDWQNIEEVIGAALGRLGRRESRVEVHLDPSMPPVCLDFALIEQVLVNLLDNALKFSGEELPVEITSRMEGSTCQVTVADRGEGIPPPDLARIFEKFHRIPGRRNTPGTGLGLSICAGIIEAHGGKIWAEPRPGGGTCFTFTLPVDAVEVRA